MTTQNDLQQRRNMLSSSKRALLEQRLLLQAQAETAAPTIPRRPMNAIVPASFAQQRLWFLEQLEPGTATYNMPIAIRIRGALQVSALEYSLNEIIRRHEALRTTFTNVEGVPIQQVHAIAALSLPVHDLSKYPADQRMSEVSQWIAREAQQAFDLEVGPLLRCQLLRVGESEHIFLLTMHHIISDAWSTGIFSQELITFYEAKFAGKPAPLADLPIQYADYAYWQMQELQDHTLEHQLTYWRQQLEQIPDPLTLPTDHPRPTVQNFHGAKHHFTLPTELTKQLHAFRQQENITLFMLIMAAFLGFLARYTGQDDILLGTSIANRTQSETERLIGFFSNTLALRTDLSGNPTVRELLARVRRVALDAYSNQDVPFERVLKRPLHLPVMFILQNTPQGTIAINDLLFEAIDMETDTAKFDLLFSLDDQPAMTGFFEYNADLFDTNTIERMADHFQTYLAAMVAHPAQRISDIEILSSAERQLLLVAWNNTHQTFPQNVTLHDLFTAQVEANPLAIALIAGEQNISYQELNTHANQLAHHLRTLGVGPEVLVGLYLERSSTQLVALLAILKAGGAYLPIDVASPDDWLLTTLQDAHVSLVLTTSNLSSHLSAYQGTLLPLDTTRTMLTEYPDTNPYVAMTPDNLAYVIYTSGSTGRPKGVQITHRSIVNHCYAIQHHYQFSAIDRVVQFASLSFDAAAEEIYPTWASGATLILRPSELATHIEEWHAWLRQMHISILDLPTVYWHYWVTRLEAHMTLPTSLRLVIVGGEQALPEHYAKWQRLAGPHIQWSNTYGPTESTVTATLYASEPATIDAYASQGMVPIGSPLANLSAYVLDRELQPVPIGVRGELYLGGAGVARGYLQRSDLTAERFLPDPYTPHSGARMYRSGDVVRALSDGLLVYCGRSDQQVKIRGYRIELGEIQAVLNQHPEVDDSIVVTRTDTLGEQYLVAYLTGNHLPEPSVIRAFLSERLPAYMLPVAFVALEAFPITTNGKIDLRALPTPDQEGQGEQREQRDPSNEVEEALVHIWQTILGRTVIGVEDNFFEIGGHSLLATQLVAFIDQAFSISLPLRLLFELPTIASLADFLLQDEQERDQILVTAQLYLQVELLSEDEVDVLLQESHSNTSETL